VSAHGCHAGGNRAATGEVFRAKRSAGGNNPPLGLTENLPASWYNICYVPKGTGETDWHNPPQRLLVLWLTGEVEFETSDGDIRRLPAGSVVLAEDTTGKGHPPEGQLVVHVAIA
jgi:hypothetical protein